VTFFPSLLTVSALYPLMQGNLHTHAGSSTVPRAEGVLGDPFLCPHLSLTAIARSPPFLVLPGVKFCSPLSALLLEAACGRAWVSW
jgi:hypothetical protein